MVKECSRERLSHSIKAQHQQARCRSWGGIGGKERDTRALHSLDGQRKQRVGVSVVRGGEEGLYQRRALTSLGRNQPGPNAQSNRLRICMQALGRPRSYQWYAADVAVRDY